jgi:hypothetical protein
VLLPDGTRKLASVKKHSDAFTWADDACDDCVTAEFQRTFGREPTHIDLWRIKLLSVKNVTPRPSSGHIGPTPDTLRRLAAGVA